MNQLPGSKTKSTVWVVEKGKKRSHLDQLATEEPLEIRLVEPRQTIAVTMRTPGADFELAAGFLYTEGVIQSKKDIQQISYCVDPDIDGDQRQNIVNIKLSSQVEPNLQPLERHFYISSACGVCGKSNLEALKLRGCESLTSKFQVSSDTLYRLPEVLRSHQNIFSKTGGLHAAALFDAQGNLLSLKEDVGRHNALDKLIGSALLADTLPWRDRIVMVSGRSSFEILQKSLMAKSPIVCAISAPSSLAVSLAKEFNMTLIGFLRGDRFNIYSAPDRIM